MPKPPTIQDLAQQLGMHKSTVSLAISGKGTISAETRKRVLAAVRELGYEPNPHAQKLASGDQTAMVCIFSGTLDVGMTTEKILLIQQSLVATCTRDVPIYTSCAPVSTPGDNALEDHRHLQIEQIRQICRQRPKAIICTTQRVHPDVFKELAAYQEKGGIVVSYDSPAPLAGDQVIFDREENAYRAARYLLEKGHRRIGLGMSRLGGSPNDPQRLRLQGFQRALAEYGVPFREDWFFVAAPYEKGGAEMARAFLNLSERPTAMAIVNDYLTLSFMIEVMRAGVRIPEDLSVIGHDNQPIAEYCPVPLTSMTQPVERIAQAVVQIVTERIDKSVPRSVPARKVVVEGELVERKSVASIMKI